MFANLRLELQGGLVVSRAEVFPNSAPLSHVNCEARPFDRRGAQCRRPRKQRACALSKKGARSVEVDSPEQYFPGKPGRRSRCFQAPGEVPWPYPRGKSTYADQCVVCCCSNEAPTRFDRAIGSSLLGALLVSTGRTLHSRPMPPRPLALLPTPAITRRLPTRSSPPPPPPKRARGSAGPSQGAF